MSKSIFYLKMFIYGFILSILIGVISFIFIYLESNLSHYLWNVILNLENYKIIVIVLASLSGGLVVGTLRKYWGDYPLIAHDTIETLKTNKCVDYQPVFKSLGVAVMILVFGAGVGPEAALLGAIVMLSVWQSDKLRYYYFNYSDIAELPVFKRIAQMLHPTKYLTHYQSNATSRKITYVKKYVNILFILNGIFAFVVLMKATKQPSFISKMGMTEWSIRDLWLFIPLLLLGCLAGELYKLFSKQMDSWFAFWNDKPIQKALIGSLGICIIACFTPSLLFSGQVSLGTVPESYQEYSLAALILIVMLKLIFLQICLKTGWIGGDIFPVVFSSIIFGYAITTVFSSFDTIFIVAVLSTTMATTMLNSYLMLAVFIALFFPIQIFPMILLTALIVKQLMKFSRKLSL